MLKLPIEPLVGVGNLHFGMTRAEAEAVLGRSHQVDEKRRRFFDALFVDFDDDGRVEFIEAGLSSLFHLTLSGQNLHELDARDAVAFVSRFDSVCQDDPELGYSFVFEKLQLCLWRSTLPDEEDPETGRRF